MQKYSKFFTYASAHEFLQQKIISLRNYFHLYLHKCKIYCIFARFFVQINKTTYGIKV